MMNLRFRGQTRRYGEKIKNFAGEPMESAWAHGPGVCVGTGDYSIIYGVEVDASEEPEPAFYDKHPVYTDTLGMSTGHVDKNGKPIYTGDIVEFRNSFDFDCRGVVKLGEYEQDGSDGEYSAVLCHGFYVETDSFTCPDGWEPENFPKYMEKLSIMQVLGACEVIGNIWDDARLLRKEEHDARTHA